MRITAINARLLRLPTGNTVGLPMAGGVDAKRESVDILLATVTTDAGVSGIGYCYAPLGGSSLLTAIADDLTPMLAGAHALDHERLWAKVQSLDHPAARRAYAAIDVALWDIKGKAANQPLWRLLGGARPSAKVFTAETAAPGLPADDVIALARDAMRRGIKGLRVSVGGIDPEADSRAIVAVRDAIGEEPWFAVTVEHSFDYETALPMARFLEEEVGADWFEDPLADDDLDGYTRLAARTDTPLAAGGRYTSLGQFVRLIGTGAPITLRPDITRLGGLTPVLKVATLAELHRRPLVPRLMPEVNVHLACGLGGVNAVEYAPWLTLLLQGPLNLNGGSLTGSTAPGMGVDIDGKLMDRFV